MKKIISVVLAFCMAFSLAGCNSKTEVKSMDVPFDIASLPDYVAEAYEEYADAFDRCLESDTEKTLMINSKDQSFRFSLEHKVSDSIGFNYITVSIYDASPEETQAPNLFGSTIDYLLEKIGLEQLEYIFIYCGDYSASYWPPFYGEPYYFTLNHNDVETEYLLEVGEGSSESPTAEAPITEAPVSEAPVTTSVPATEDPSASSATFGQLNALEQALSYLRVTSFSYEGLIDQLEYEGYTLDEATYGADHCGADWNEQALSSAKSYLEVSSFSYTGLIEQLEYEKFTTEQATYGADNCGADWNEQAAKSAASYLEIMSFSREGLIEQLQYEGFTYDQAVYGVTQNGY